MQARVSKKLGPARLYEGWSRGIKILIENMILEIVYKFWPFQLNQFYVVLSNGCLNHSDIVRFRC